MLTEAIYKAMGDQTDCATWRAGEQVVTFAVWDKISLTELQIALWEASRSVVRGRLSDRDITKIVVSRQRQ